MKFEDVEGLKWADVALTFAQVYAISFAFSASHRFSKTFGRAKGWSKEFSLSNNEGKIKIFDNMLEEIGKSGKKIEGRENIEAKINAFRKMAQEGKEIPKNEFGLLCSELSNYLYMAGQAKQAKKKEADWEKSDKKAGKSEVKKSKGLAGENTEGKTSAEVEIRVVKDEKLAAQLRKMPVHDCKNLMWMLKKTSEKLAEKIEDGGVDRQLAGIEAKSNATLELFAELNIQKMDAGRMQVHLQEMKSLSSEYPILQKHLGKTDISKLSPEQMRQKIADITADAKKQDPELYDFAKDINKEANPNGLSTQQINEKIAQIKQNANDVLALSKQMLQKAKGKENTQEYADLERQVQMLEEGIRKFDEAAGEYEFSLQNIGQIVKNYVAKSGYPVKVSVVGENYAKINMGLFEEAFNNLYSNAKKYAHGTPVEVEVFAQKGQIKIRVSNIGKGLRPQEVYNAFNRIKNDNATPESTGFGLPSARETVRQLFGGEVDYVAGESGKTTFEISLPAQIPKTQSGGAGNMYLFPGNLAELFSPFYWSNKAKYEKSMTPRGQ
jgi:signal transduction histidine kinase